MAETNKDNNFPKVFTSWALSDENIVPHLESIANYSKIEHLFETPEKQRRFLDIFKKNVEIAQKRKGDRNFYRANYSYHGSRSSSGFANSLWTYNLLKLYPSQSLVVNEPEERIIHLDETSRIEKMIKNIYKDNEELYRVEPRDFEKMIQELLRQKNFATELTKTTHDGGIDIIAIKEMDGFTNKYLIQCKRYGKNNPVDVGVVRELFGIINKQNANKGIIFTSSYFSPFAKKEAEETPFWLELRDGIDVINWVKDYIKEKEF